MSRLLVVDDNQQNCQLLETLLTRHGYDVLVAADGVEALKAARENPPDMIITDILMPGMDGYALCRQWKRDEKLKKIPFVFYTATYTDPKDEQLALRMGANRFIRKPQESQALVDIIEEIIETHKVGPRNPPSKPVLEETVYLKEYNQALIRKLEDKLVELESAKASLEREVAERKRTEETIRLTAEHLRRFVDANIVGVVIANAAGDVIEANNYYLNLIGFTQDDLKANRVDWRAITPPEWLPADENAIRELRERGKCTPYEKEFVRRDGTRVSVFLADALLPGTEEQIIAFALDLTDRKRAEHDILASETRYRRLFESAKEGILILDADTGEIVDANPFLLDLLGFTHEYFLGKRLWEIGTFRDIAASEAAFLELQEKGYVRYEDLPLETRDGQRVEVEFVSNVYLVDSTKVVQCNIRDITERVRADQERMRLAAAVERAGESFIITDADGDITYVNPAFERTSGYSAEEVLGKTPRILKSGRHGAQVYTHFWDTIVQGETWSGRFTNKKKDGTPYEVAATVTPMIGANGEIVGYVGVERDITREIQLEAQFRQTQKMEAIATLAGGIAHDFNNILSAVMGYTEMARQDLPVNSPARNALEQVHCAGVRATDLVRQILSFSREREKEYLPLQVNLVVKEVLKLLQATIPSSIRIEESIAPDCALILSDPSQIHQIVMNLCTNAYQAMPGGGVLEVRLENVRIDGPSAKAAQDLGEGEFVRLTVTDTGHGMDDATLERVFEPFFTTKSDGGGTGLGLATVHGIVKNHGGTITVYSEPGRGTTFRVYFPALGPEVKSAEQAAATIAIPKGNGEHVLLVDDEESLMILGRNMLERLGYRVTACCRVVEALSTFSAQPNAFDLIVTDQTMPVLTGLLLIQELRKLRPDIPAILCTGFSKVTTPEAAASAGISEILRKPISLASLAQAVHKALAQHRANSRA